MPRLCARALPRNLGGENNKNLPRAHLHPAPSPAPSSSRLSLRVHHTSSLLQLLSLLHSFAMPTFGNLHIQPMQALRRSNESHASFCSPPSALPCPNSSSPCSNSSCGITPKFHYTIELDARGIRRARNVSLVRIRLQRNSPAWIGILRQDEIYPRA
jgi:hypothetical protein